MKKFFTKWLPVEGEIMEGDFFLIKDIHPQGQLRKCWEIYTWDAEYNKENVDQLMIDNPKDKKRGWGFCKRNEVNKAKLFLCSKDVQIDDKFRFEKELLQEHISEVGNSMFDHRYWVLGNNGQLYDRTKCFKVIGEISSDAVSYVKEGHEYDLTEIQICLTPKYKEDWKNYPKEAIDRSNGKYVKTVYPNSPSFGRTRWEVKNPNPEDVTVKIKGPCGHFH